MPKYSCGSGLLPFSFAALVVDAREANSSLVVLLLLPSRALPMVVLLSREATPTAEATTAAPTTNGWMAATVEATVDCLVDVDMMKAAAVVSVITEQ